ncbi:hypothetical protein SAMN06295888_12348 [Desulfonatronum zhilinae]|nr:hypothetical protein SAMN06295888_12348 [Desulfonatronum zhilinae]
MTDQQAPRDQDMLHTAAALKRAAKKARELALRTQTPLVVYRDGKVEKQMIVREEPPS